jgi:hypothetical protein
MSAPYELGITRSTLYRHVSPTGAPRGNVVAAPEHYSRDIVLRCQSLIRHLLPKVEERLSDEAQFGGPLRTTFLLAMATPMIVLYRTNI